MINFRQSLYTEEHEFTKQPTEISDISGLEVKIKNVLVRNTNTPTLHSFPGYAKVYFLNLVAVNLPDNSLRVQLKSFEKVENDDALPVEKAVFSWKKERPSDKAPNQLLVFSSLIKSKQPLRDVASVLSEAQRDSSYKLLSGTLNSLLQGNTDSADISNLLFNLAAIIGKYLGKVDEKPLFSWLQSFTGMDSDREILGKTEKSAANQFAAFALSLTIKNKVRLEEEALLERTDRRTMAGGQGLFA